MPSSTFPLGIQDSLILPKGEAFDTVTAVLTNALQHAGYTRIEWVGPLLGHPTPAVSSLHSIKGFVGYQWPFYLRTTQRDEEKGDPFNLFLNELPPFHTGYVAHRVSALLDTIQAFYDAKKK